MVRWFGKHTDFRFFAQNIGYTPDERGDPGPLPMAHRRVRRRYLALRPDKQTLHQQIGMMFQRAGSDLPLSKMKGRLVMTYLFAGLMLLVAAGTWFWVFWVIILGIASKRWPAVDGMVGKSYIEKHDPAGGGRHQQSIYHINYEYTVSGKIYSGKRRMFSENYFSQIYSRAYAESLVEKYPPGSRVSVRYDPRRPGQSVLEPGVNLLKQYWVIVLGMITLSGGIYLLMKIIL
jgi:hypothetical protein